jgi:6,7-dimethyl-8-ribityllumazine synthase
VPDFSFRLRAVGRVAILASRYNELITNRLLEGALACCAEAGLARDAVDVVWVPGAFELPVAAAAAAGTKRYVCLVALGAVVRGDTPHFDYVAGQAATGVAKVGLDAGVPVIFGVLTTDTAEQAEARAGGKAGNKGADAALAAIETVNVLRAVKG